MRRFLHLVGTLMVVAGLGTLAWAGLVWRWQDPFTAVYTHWKQHQLGGQLDKRFVAFRPEQHGGSLAAERRAVADDARRYRRSVHRGDAIGRIKIPRMGLNMVVVNGTDHDTLTKGPGRDFRTFMPGENELVYLAGHRTTYLAPFSHIDQLRKGDRITIEMPYATFVYRVTGHRIVTATDLSVLTSRHREVLELQACHPRFFATHRYIAYAVPVRIVPRGGTAFAPGAEQLAAG